MKNKTIFKDFIKYVSLNILGQTVYSCYTLTDTFFVSYKLGTNGLTALNLAFPIFCIINGIGLMIGMGGGTKYSIYKSRKDNEKANKIFTNSLYISLFFSIILVLTGLFFSKYIIKFLGADDSVFEMTNTYAKVMLLFTPAFLLNSLLQCFVRNDGKPLFSMVAMVVGSLSNILLDYIFIFPLNMGIFGAILATGISPIISILILCPYLIMRKNKFHLAKTKPNLTNIKDILSSGFSPFLTEVTSGVVMFLFNFIILKISGNIGIAAFSVITVISLVVIAIYTGLSEGIQPLISKKYGENKIDDVKILLRYSMITMIILSCIIYSITFLRATDIASIFNSEKNATLQELSETGLKIYFIACPFIGFNIVLATYFYSIEKPFFAQIISLARGFIILIPTAFLLSYIFKMMGVWSTYPVSEFIVTLIAVTLYIVNKRKQPSSKKKN